MEQGVDLAGSSAEAEESHPPIRIRGVQLDGRPTTATAVSPTGRTGLMGAAQAVANGLLGGVLPALLTPTEGVANRPTTISDELRADDEEYDENESIPKAQPLMQGAP